VAEGVESREGWDMLVALGCDMAQGFVVCPPLTPNQFGEWLDRRQPGEFAYLDDRTEPAVDAADVNESTGPVVVEVIAAEELAFVGVDGDGAGDGDGGDGARGHGANRDRDGDGARNGAGDPEGDGGAPAKRETDQASGQA
jgi:hypothetical protein